MRPGRRPALLLGLTLGLTTAACGNDDCNQLFGSAQDAMQLSFSQVKIQWLPIEQVLQVLYKDAGGATQVRFSVDLTGLTPAGGLKVDLAEELGEGPAKSQRGNAYAVSEEDEGAVVRGTLSLESWDGPGQEAEGSFFTTLASGRTLNGDFCGPVEELSF